MLQKLILFRSGFLSALYECKKYYNKTCKQTIKILFALSEPCGHHSWSYSFLMYGICCVSPEHMSWVPSVLCLRLFSLEHWIPLHISNTCTVCRRICTWWQTHCRFLQNNWNGNV